MHRPALPLPTLLVLLVLLAACDERQPTVITGEAMGTTYRVRIEDRDIDEVALERRLAAELAEIEAQASTWQNDSWLSRFNRGQSLEAQRPPDHVWQLLLLSDTLVNQTHGAFDPTIGPLVHAWGYGPGGSPGSISTPDLPALLQYTGWDKIELDTANQTVRKLHPSVELDFSAIGKGYAVDRIAALLDEAGCRHYLVEFGGEVLGRGPESADAWSVGVQQPGARPGTHGKPITLRNQAAATSGTYYQDRAADHSSHLIDPRSGQPVPPAAQSVTVLMPSCAEADAWATALMVLGQERGKAVLAGRADIAVYWTSD